jgi:Tol biopolymer transport system component
VAVVESTAASDRSTTPGPSRLLIVDILSGGVRTLAATRDGRQAFAVPRWSPDGQSLAIELDRYAEVDQAMLSGSSIWIVSVPSSGAGVLRQVTPWGTFGAYPDWRPDGFSLLFSTYDLDLFPTGGVGPSNLYTVHPDGSGLVQVTSFTGPDARAGQAGWTPDGSLILYTEADGSDFNGLGARHPTFASISGSRVLQFSTLGTFPRQQPTP